MRETLVDFYGGGGGWWQWAIWAAVPTHVFQGSHPLTWQRLRGVGVTKCRTPLSGPLVWVFPLRFPVALCPWSLLVSCTLLHSAGAQHFTGADLQCCGCLNSAVPFKWCHTMWFFFFPSVYVFLTIPVPGTMGFTHAINIHLQRIKQFVFLFCSINMMGNKSKAVLSPAETLF